MTGTTAVHDSIGIPPPSANGSAAAPSPAPQQPQQPQHAPDRARLSLDPATWRQAGIHGGWWPRSRDASAELPGLIAEMNARAGRVSRVALQADAFANIPHKLTVAGRKVPVAWFRYMNQHTAILTMASRDYLILLVIPPRASPDAAAEALRLAASGRHAGPPEAILSAAGIPVSSSRQGALIGACPAGDLDAAETDAADLAALARLDDDGAPSPGVPPRPAPKHLGGALLHSTTDEGWVVRLVDEPAEPPG